MFKIALWFFFMILSGVFGVLAGVPGMSLYLFFRDICIITGSLFLYEFLIDLNDT